MGNECALKGSSHRFVLNLQAFSQTRLGTHIYDHRDRSGQIMKCDCRIKGNCIVVKTIDGLDILTSLDDYQSLNKNKILYMVDVRFGPQSFIVGEHAFKYEENPIICPVWQVVTQPMEVQIGDIFKLSSHIIRVADIRTINKPQIFSKKFRQLSSSNASEDRVCRLCYTSHATAENPILKPCRCQGSIKYVHAECLKMTVKASSSFTATPNGMRMTRAAFACPICREQYPKELFSQAKSYADIFLQDRVQPPYIKLEVLANDDGDSNYIIVESFAHKNQLKIGRKKDCDIKLGLEYLSRYHTSLIYDQESQKVFIQDLGSSFGTLRYIKGPNLLCFQNQELKLQFGNTVVNFKAGVIAVKPGPYKQNNFPQVQSIIQQAQGFIHSNISLKMMPQITPMSQSSVGNPTPS